MRKSYFLSAIIFFLLYSVDAEGQKITFCPQWTPQSQFAGYYIAQEKGFYKEEGLDVTIKHRGINSTETPMSTLSKGDAQIIGMQLLQGIIARSDGMDLVNVMQLTQVSGLWCVCRTPVKEPKDLDGLKIGKWKIGFSDFCEFLEFYKGIKIDWIPFIDGTNLYVFGAIDGTLCYGYSEYVTLKLAIGDIPDSQVLKFSEHGYDCPEDGLYVLDDYYRKNKESVDKFVRASKRGWDYTREHIDEALAVSKKYSDAAHIRTNDTKERMMLEEYLKLQVNPKTTMADYSRIAPDTFGRIVDAMLTHGHITNAIKYEDFIK